MSNRGRNISGALMLIVLAVAIVLWKLNIFNLPVVFAGVSTWGLIIAAFMVWIIIHSIADLSFGGIFLPLAVICIIFDKPLGIEAITPWIVLIVAVMLTVAFNMLFPKRHRHHHHHDEIDFGHKFTESTSTDNDEYVMHSMKFGSATKYVRSQNLKEADLRSQFGELSVFFDGAQVPGGKVYIHVNASFGEMQLFIPAGWKLENKVKVSLGDCTDRGTNVIPADNAVVCVIEGSVSFGELEINRI
jgi:predicted membrane protein